MTQERAARGNGAMGIAMMIETLALGGAENVVLQLADELRRRGHRILAVGPAGRTGWLLDQVRARGYAWEAYDLRRVIDPGLPRRMARMLEAHEIDVIHSHEFTASVYGAAAARLIRRPQIVTMHGNQVMMDRFRRRVALRWAFRNSSATVAVSDETRRHLEDTLGLKPGAVQVILNGIPRRPGDRERTRRALGIGEHELLLLAVGSLVPRKGHAVMRAALAGLTAGGEATAWRAAVAGTGEERERLEALAVQLGVAERFRLLGPRDDIPDLQAAADIFVMPSLWEGLPLAILEAMFAGNTIVASRTSGIPEALDHETHGLLVPPGDVGALADTLHAVMVDAGLRKRLGQAALARAESTFTIEAMADRYLELYRSSSRSRASS